MKPSARRETRAIVSTTNSGFAAPGVGPPALATALVGGAGSIAVGKSAAAMIQALFTG